MSYKTALLANGPKAGTNIQVGEETKQIDIPMMVPGCIHSPVTFKTISYKPMSPTDTVWITDFDAQAIGMWCQKCDVSRETEAREQVNNIRKLHFSYPHKVYRQGEIEIIDSCNECSKTGSGYEYYVEYPCPTIIVLDGDDSWKNGKWDYVDD